MFGPKSLTAECSLAAIALVCALLLGSCLGDSDSPDNPAASDCEALTVHITQAEAVPPVGKRINEVHRAQQFAALADSLTELIITDGGVVEHRDRLVVLYRQMSDLGFQLSAYRDENGQVIATGSNSAAYGQVTVQQRKLNFQLQEHYEQVRLYCNQVQADAP
ncbi:MAG: hypothetical protein AAFV90_19405 [Cyanobacteria bacterium J06634_5]